MSRSRARRAPGPPGPPEPQVSQGPADGVGPEFEGTPEHARPPAVEDPTVAGTDLAETATASVKGSQNEMTRQQIRGSSLLLVGRALSMAINFGSQILIVRYLSINDYGAFAYALSLVMLGQSVALFGLDRAFTRFVPIYDERRDYAKVFGTMVMVVGAILGIGIAMILVVYGGQAFIAESLIDDRQAVSILLIMIFLSPIQALDSLLVGLFAVYSKPRAIFYRKYVVAPGLRLVVVLLLVLSNSTVVFLAAGYVVSGALGLLIYGTVLVRLLRSQGMFRRFSFSTMIVPVREVLSFTIPLLTSDLVHVLMLVSGVVVLGHYGGTSEVAAYRAIQPAAHLNIFAMASFTTLFTPLAARLFARDDKEGINKMYWQTAIWLAVISFPVFALTFSLAQPVTVAMFGERYEQSAVLLTLLSLGYYFNAAIGFNGLTLKVFGRMRYIIAVNLGAAVVNVGLNFLLIPRYGALGAAMGACGTLIAHNIFKQAGLRLGTGITLFEWRHVLVYSSIVVSAAALFAVQVILDPPLIAGIALAGIASLLVLGLARNSLRVDEVFPELMRFRWARVLAGHER
jgi:O-antigen/teichoic acid export membrane protein